MRRAGLEPATRCLEAIWERTVCLTCGNAPMARAEAVQLAGVNAASHCLARVGYGYARYLIGGGFLESLFYELDAWGPAIGGASGARTCTLNGLAKIASANSPYAVGNELICSRLGLLIGLPVPPGLITRTDDDEPAYVSIRFGPKGQLPPPANSQHLVEDNPSLAAGIIAFDCWTANDDRHEQNLAYVREPKIPLAVFDHERALLGQTAGAGTGRLKDERDNPHVGGCLCPYVTSDAEFSDWASRIGSVSARVIRDLAAMASAAGAMTADEASAIEEFLVHRKSRILPMIQASQATLPNVTQWGMA